MRAAGAMRRLVGGIVVGLIALVAIGGGSPVSSERTRSDTLFIDDDEADFLAKRRVAVTETFDHPTEFSPDQRIVNFQGMKFKSLDPEPPFWSVGQLGDADCPEVCYLVRGFSDAGPGSDELAMTVRFRDGGAVFTLGFELVGTARRSDGTPLPNQFVIRIVEVDGSVTPIRLPANIGDTYIGLHSAIGIRKVVILQNHESNLTNFGLDNVSRSSIRDDLQ